MHEKQFGKDFNFGRAGLLRARSVLREQAQSLAVFVKKDNPNEKPEARWVSVSEGAPKCVTSPWDVSRFFRTAVFGRMQGVLVASATLAALGTFRSILRDLGLPDDTRTLQLQSPFDHSGSRMVVPKLAIDPSNMRMHTAILKAFVVERALKHADGGVLVYFSARARMQAVLEQLSEEQRECVLAQGDYSVPGIIEVHKRRIDEGKRSVIFGLDSFAEGIDLPGRYCTLMIVDKIPFPAPNEPLIAAATEWITAQGGNAFSIVTLPRTGRKLAQLTGRLVRQEGDSGTIYVLDTRLLNKPYGRQLAAGTAYQPQVDY
jgi:ATP-dependent DNA helicase DinG